MKDADNAHDVPSEEDDELEELPPAETSHQADWIGTPEACARLGVTLRTLYRFIDAGQLPAYKMGRVIRLRAHEVEEFIQNARIAPGMLEHLYPEPHPRPARGRRGPTAKSSRSAPGRPRSPRVGRGGEGDGLPGGAEQPPAGDPGQSDG